MKKLYADFALVIILIAALVGAILFLKAQNYSIKSPIVKKVEEITEKPFEKYSFENLQTTTFEESEIILGQGVENKNEKIKSQKFYYNTQDPRDPSKTYKVSGLINTPSADGTYPVIIMFRGFVERYIYETGVGTNRAGQVLAENGFITLAPDFLGYGESDLPSESSIEERFQTYTTSLSLFSSLQSLNTSLSATNSGKILADTEKIGIWAHSNGGQIALSVLAISGKKYPTVLWNPVTKPFPYSILFFTDDFDDEGKALRKVVADFENDYDVFLYSPAKYYDWIQAPIQLHQGQNDDAVPVKWSDQFNEMIEEKEKDIEYFTYPNSDHNLMPGGWETAVDRSMNFYKERFEEE